VGVCLPGFRFGLGWRLGLYWDIVVRGAHPTLLGAIADLEE
jgi:hypothetical protein